MAWTEWCGSPGDRSGSLDTAVDEYVAINGNIELSADELRNNWGQSIRHSTKHPRLAGFAKSACFCLRGSGWARSLGRAPGMFGVSLWSTGVSVALQLGPSGASLSGRGNG
jgi:hypothetical protein